MSRVHKAEGREQRAESSEQSVVSSEHHSILVAPEGDYGHVDSLVCSGVLTRPIEVKDVL